ncbi:MAG: TonB-dependent receptor plug domain-containing protein [Bacteroidales bacterium]
MKIKLVFLIFFSILSVSSLIAQKDDNKIAIKGTVLNADKEPVVNAIVMIDGIKTRTITDSKGNFRITVAPTATRIGIFTFGYGLHEEDIYGRTRINFNFENPPSWILHGRDEGISVLGSRKIASGEESVDVGYAHMKKKDITTDISFIDGTDKKYASYSSIAEMIWREVSGVRVLGTPGNYIIIIQGSGNLLGNVPPLIVIDGMPGGSINDIQPSSVASISVLKGTAATIYGSRGYGGAILIRTKTYDEY